MSSPDFGLIISRGASDEIKKYAKYLEANIPGSSIFVVPNPGRMGQLRWASIIGGDGTVNLGIQAFQDQGINPLIGIDGRGLNNVLFTELRRKRSQLAYSNLRGMDQAHLPFFAQIRPGLFGDTVFINQVCFGQYEQYSGLLNKTLKTYPSSARRILVLTMSLFQTLLARNGEDRMLDIYSIGPKIGPYTAFPRQDFYSDAISHGYSLGSSYLAQAISLLWTLPSWRINQNPPSNAFQTEDSLVFDVEYPQPKIWIDGDTILNPHKEKVPIRRADETYSFVALHRQSL